MAKITIEIWDKDTQYSENDKTNVSVKIKADPPIFIADGEEVPLTPAQDLAGEIIYRVKDLINVEEL